MKEDAEFRCRAEEALHSLYDKLSSAEDELDFGVSLASGTLQIARDGGRSPVTVNGDPSSGHIRVRVGANQYRLGWDIVENAFVRESTGQTLQELIEETVSEMVGDDVSL